MTLSRSLIIVPLALSTLTCQYKAPDQQLPPPGRAPAATRPGLPAEQVTPPATPLKTAPPSTVVARPAFTQLKAPKEVGLSDIAEQAVRSVVNISSTRMVSPKGRNSPYHSDPFFHFYRRRRPQRRAQSRGSGVIVTTDGVVLTNNHVVAKAQDIKVKLHDGRVLKAALVGTDPKSDLAVLRLQGEPKGLIPMPLGLSRKLRLGQVVLAIGNPFGLGQTVTMGIVSAVGRANMGIVDYEDFIQTDAAINPGNSGGALVDMRGRLVGINTAIYSRSGGYQGIGFAIPSDMVRPIMTSLLQHGRVVRGWLGVGIQPLTREIAAKLGITYTRGVLVAGVQPGSPADKGGLRRDDVVTSLNGEAMISAERLRNRVASVAPGTAVKLELLRGGAKKALTVTLGELGGKTVATLDRSKGALGGLSLESLTTRSRRRLGLAARQNGVLVTRVEWGSAAQSAGLQEGDVIVEIDRKPVASASQFEALYDKSSGKIALLIFRRGSGTMYLLLQK